MIFSIGSSSSLDSGSVAISSVDTDSGYNDRNTDDVVDVDIADVDNVDDIRENKLLTLIPVIIIQQSQ